MGGGGICCDMSSSPTFMNCTITGNSAEIGGGLSAFSSHATLINCIVSGNTAKNRGGGLYWKKRSTPTLINCVITGNKAPIGGGIYSHGSHPKLTNCTISMNDKDGIRCAGSNPVIANTILWDNGREIVRPRRGKPKHYPDPHVLYSNIKGGFAGEGNLDSDPGFIDPHSGDFRLKKDSPCIDAGSNDVKSLPETDTNGNPRIVGGIVDIGAYEHIGDSSTDQNEARPGK